MGRTLRSVAAISLAGLFTVAGATAVQAADVGEEVTPPTPIESATGRYIVVLDEAPVATYEGGEPGLDATKSDEARLDADSPQARKYSAFLEERQQNVADEAGVRPDATYTIAVNGFSASMDPNQAAKLAATKGVQKVVPDEIRHPVAVPSTEFLGLEGDNGVWQKIGGIGSAGEGVVVGVVDTGIAPENPAFAGEPLGTTAGSEPYLDGNDVVFRKGDGTDFRSPRVAEGNGWSLSDYSTKLVGARYFDQGAAATGFTFEADYRSPRDGDAHGSHTASTAAGNNGVDASVEGIDFDAISGVAPAAKVAAYKACWAGPDPLVTTDDVCALSDLLGAINAAVSDGVDVINYSIGGGGATSTFSATDQAFLGAASAGVFVAASAGNDGPTATTADNAAPWITTVAASTIPSYSATVQTADGTEYLGGSITVPTGTDGLTGDFVSSTAVAAAGADATAVTLCAPDTLDPAKAAGTIVLCDRGVYDRTAKSAEVERAGGIGMVLVNPTSSSVDLDEHAVPTVHLNADDYDAIHAYADTEGATVTLLDGNPGALPEPASPQIAGFSSRGPVTADGGNLLKPDISAPGVAILADGANAQGEPGTYEFLSGTSMSSPHIAGLAALYLSKGVHPDWTPDEVKSAMMTTAYDLVGEDGAPSQDVFAQGAGHVDPTAFLEPGLLYENGPADWQAYVDSIDTVEGTDSSLNLASISVGSLAGTAQVTRTVTSTEAGTYTVAPIEMDGVTATVEPSTLTFGAAGEKQDYTVTFTRTTAALDQFATGYLTWSDGTHDVRSPLAVRPVQLQAPAEVAGEGATGEKAFDVTAGDALELPLTTEGLAAGQVASGSGTAGAAAAETPVTIAEGTTHARFVLDSADDTADLDLLLYTADADGAPDQLAASSATGSADEQIDLDAPAAGEYVLLVDFYSGAGQLDYTLTSYLLDPAAAVGGLTVDPATLSAGLGETATLTASWTGLPYEQTFLGRVVYGDTGQVTYLTVASGEEPEPPTPTDPGPGPGQPGHPGGWSLADILQWIWNALGDLFHGWFPWRG